MSKTWEWIIDRFLFIFFMNKPCKVWESSCWHALRLELWLTVLKRAHPGAALSKWTRTHHLKSFLSCINSGRGGTAPSSWPVWLWGSTVPVRSAPLHPPPPAAAGQISLRERKHMSQVQTCQPVAVLMITHCYLPLKHNAGMTRLLLFNDCWCIHSSDFRHIYCLINLYYTEKNSLIIIII